MKYSKLIAAFLVCAVMAIPAMAQEEAPQEKIKFAKKAVVKNTKITMAQIQSMIMVQNMIAEGMPPMAINNETKEKKIGSITALEIGDKGITKATVEFKELVKTEKMTGPMGDTDEAKNSPLPGNSYTVTLKDGALSATDKEGEEVTTEVLTALTKEFAEEMKNGSLHNPYSHLDAVLDGREMSIGEKIKLDKATVAKIMGNSEVPATFDLTLKAKKTFLGVECAVFDVVVNMEKPEGAPESMEITTEIKGEWTVGISNIWSYNLKVGGPINGNGELEMQGMSIAIEVTGKMSMSIMNAYQLPAQK